VRTVGDAQRLEAAGQRIAQRVWQKRGEKDNLARRNPVVHQPPHFASDPIQHLREEAQRLVGEAQRTCELCGVQRCGPHLLGPFERLPELGGERLQRRRSREGFAEDGRFVADACQCAPVDRIGAQEPAVSRVLVVDEQG